MEETDPNEAIESFIQIIIIIIKEKEKKIDKVKRRDIRDEREKAWRREEFFFSFFVSL